MGWPEDEADKIRRSGEKSEQTQRWTLHVEQVIKRDARQFFDLLAGRIETDIKRFNTALPSGQDGIQFERRTETFVIARKVGYPVARVNVILDPSLAFIKLDRFTKADTFDEPSERQEQLRFKVDAEDHLSLAGQTFEDAAETILSPVIKAYSHK